MAGISDEFAPRSNCRGNQNNKEQPPLYQEQSTFGT